MSSEDVRGAGKGTHLYAHTLAHMVSFGSRRLRASFVTWVRNSEASPEILKQAARAMRHKKECATRIEPSSQAAPHLSTG